MIYNKDSFKLFKLTFSLSKSFYMFAFLRAIAETGKVFIGVIGLKLLIDSLIARDLEGAFIVVGAIIILEIIFHFLFLTTDTMVRVSTERLITKVKQFISSKLMNTEYKYLEDPKYLDIADKTLFSIESLGALDRFLNAIIGLLSHFAIMLSLLSIIVYFSPIILVVIVIGVFLNRMTMKRSAIKQIKVHGEMGQINRKFVYYSNAVSEVKYAKDFRIYPLSELIYNRFDVFLDKTCGFMYRFYMIDAKYQIIGSIINNIQISLFYLYIGYIAITQDLGIANYVFLTAAAIKASSAIGEFVVGFVRIRETSQLLTSLDTIANFEDAITKSVDGPSVLPLSTLEFKDVSFKYPGSDVTVLEKISFTINQGEKVSIVGINGAGKTTIVKLLCRFYTPDAGEILWNGKNINHYNYQSYINQIAAVFQDFKLFSLKISENIDLEEKKHHRINECLQKVGLEEKINSLPNKASTYLSKEYHEGGIELSGGEQQKIVIARAMYKSSSLNILDEPTSSLDPLSEAEVYENFATLVEGTTTIYISHRMSSSVFCDKIIVLNNKTVQDIDTHENLLKNKNSKYYELFNYQKDYYKLSVKSNKV